MKNIIEPTQLPWNNAKIEGFFSKELIEIQNGGLKLMKVAPLSEYPLHEHPNKTEFVYVLEGTPGITIAKEYFTGKQGDFFIFPQSTKHGICNKGSAECILLVGSIRS